MKQVKQVKNTAIKPKPSVRGRTNVSSIFSRGGTYKGATVPTCQVYLVAAEHIKARPYQTYSNPPTTLNPV